MPLRSSDASGLRSSVDHGSAVRPDIGGTDAGYVAITRRLKRQCLQINRGPRLSASEEQRAIADYLDRETARIDTLIEEQQRLIEMLRERREAVDSSVWGARGRPT